MKYRKRKLNGQSEQARTTSEENQPYLQQKGELEAEEKRKFELQAEERRYELKNDHICEMSISDNEHELTIQRTQELGCEASRENRIQQ